MSTEVAEAASACRVRQIETKRLFGLYNHKVPLSLTDRVSIVHGANGVGKTVLLKLVHSIFSEDYAFLASVPYDEIIITLTNGTTIHVEQSRLSEESETARPVGAQVVTVIRFTVFRDEAALPIDFTYRSDQLNFDKWAKDLESRTSWLQHLGPNQYYDQRTEQVFTATDLWREYYVDSPNRMPTPLSVEVPKELRVVLSQVKTHLVEAQRLVRWAPRAQVIPRRAGSSPALTPTVLVDARELAAKMNEAFNQYGRTSQQLDQTFPQRLFGHSQSMDGEAIKNTLAEIEAEQSKLAKLGVLDSAPPQALSPTLLDQPHPEKLAAMELFVLDSKLKLQLLTDFASRVEPLLSNINSKFQNKTLRLDRNKGLVAVAADGSEIRPDQLSSGEQHEIVLLFDLLFRVSKDALLLIDEPELSLHIDWQTKFLPDLLAIAASAQIDALVATHSPYIAGERDDLMIDLNATRD